MIFDKKKNTPKEEMMVVVMVLVEKGLRVVKVYENYIQQKLCNLRA